jgi:hypothetical protein
MDLVDFKENSKVNLEYIIKQLQKWNIIVYITRLYGTFI